MGIVATSCCQLVGLASFYDVSAPRGEVIP